MGLKVQTSGVCTVTCSCGKFKKTNRSVVKFSMEVPKVPAPKKEKNGKQDKAAKAAAKREAEQAERERRQNENTAVQERTAGAQEVAREAAKSGAEKLFNEHTS